jgi:MinD-like ATPase involved in chromosome partitioning or flagellar assembly
MGRINLAIVDQDTQYLDLFLNYLRKSDYSGRIAVKAFSRLDLLQQSLDQGQLLDIIVVDANLAQEDHNVLRNPGLILLSADPLYQREGCLVIQKYQALHQILEQIMTHYMQDHDVPQKVLGGNRSTKIISVYSGTGGCGKTTLAINLAAVLASQGQRVFLLNLESLPVIDIIGASQDSGDFSRMLYYLKGNTAQVLNQAENLKKPSCLGNFHTFKPSRSMQDMLEMTGKETAHLLEALSKSGLYDVIVIDLESSIHDRIIAALNESDLVFWILLDDFQCLQKNRMLLDDLQQTGHFPTANGEANIRFVLNKRLDRIYNDPQQYNLRVSGHLPYVPEWKSVSTLEQMVNVPIFRQEANRLYNGISD